MCTRLGWSGRWSRFCFALRAQGEAGRRAPGETSRFAILRCMVKKAETNTINVGLVQMNCVENPEANLKKAIARIGEAAKKGAQIVCLQELFGSQYFCQTEDIELF